MSGSPGAASPPALADVAIPVAAPDPFTYRIPEELRGRIVPGQRVPVPLGRRRTHGYVVRVHDDPPPERLRALGAPDPETPLLTPPLLELCRWVADYYLAPLGEVLEGALPRIPFEGRGRDVEAPVQQGPLDPAPSLTPEQEAVVAAVGADLDPPRFVVHHLQGVPGSGKTEVYLALADRVIGAGGSVLILEPEIGLATHILERVRRRYGALAGLYHSQTGVRERRATWERARAGAIRIVVGARSAVFVPLERPGLLVVDEEQEPAYKQEDAPRYHGRDVAVVRARIEGIPILLGSATPSLEAWWNVRSGKFRGHRLAERYAGRPPARIEVVDLRADPGLRPSGAPVSLFSAALVTRIRRRLEAGELSILFLNRRGHSTVVQCSACGEMIRCGRCDVVMTFHRATDDLRCHHCGRIRTKPERCPACEPGRLFYGGAGTQKLEEQLAALFPRARILRLDTDSTRRRGSHAAHLAAIDRGEVDLLIGTQMVAKGFDFPRVTLVGVLQADREMGLPEFRAAERAFQVLTQVAGRAGRGESPGEVIVQTMTPDHYVIQAAARGDFERFAAAEIETRRPLAYPPFTRMAHLLFDGRVEGNVRNRAEATAAALAPRASRSGVELLGPAPMFLTRLKGSYRWHLTLKGARSDRVHRLARFARELRPPPGTRGVRLQVDIDPIRTL
ncbi:MAG: primosomal protein N' [Candidatus Eisenbacteria bacterium]|nr:primosomal protein N' [Candidatus Latescibacterota bacterium]MBD3301305.1 primosomal protein N' [Candidatus Eisenbacteria bacterium]